MHTPSTPPDPLAPQLPNLDHEMHTVYPENGVFQFEDINHVQHTWLHLSHDPAKPPLMRIVFHKKSSVAECYLEATERGTTLSRFAGPAVLLRSRDTRTLDTAHFLRLPDELPQITQLVVPRSASLESWRPLKECVPDVVHYFHDAQGRLALGLISTKAPDGTSRMVVITCPANFVPFRCIPAAAPRMVFMPFAKGGAA